MLSFSTFQKIFDYLETTLPFTQYPLYTSVDIRQSAFKTAVVDTNLYPAGFNNLQPDVLQKASLLFKEYLTNHGLTPKRILLITEEHTRNVWYLENVLVLQTLLQEAGFDVLLASFFTHPPDFCEDLGYVELQTASQRQVRLYCLKRVLDTSKQSQFDAVILNNDLSTGPIHLLDKWSIPIFPSMSAGWYLRRKSQHFSFMNQLFQTISEELGLSCQQWTCLFRSVSDVDIHEESDRYRLYQEAVSLFQDIQVLYQKQGIQDKPLLFLKSDSGTYGMGVQAIEFPEDILTLNRKSRNNLDKGKGGRHSHHFLIQEGIPTQLRVNQQVAEPCLYSIGHHFLGGFYRLNAQKNTRENLNSSGMTFSSFMASDDAAFLETDEQMRTYLLLARVASMAAAKEIEQLQNL